jgi:hypothetical protein
MFALSYPTDAPLLRSAIVLCLVAIPISLLLLGFDRRVLDHEALWLKPLKFYPSLAVHGISVLLAARFLPEAWQTHTIAKIGLFAFGAVIIYEAVFLSLQAARGVRSHFNETTTFDAIGGSIMAAGAGVLVIVPLILGAALAVAALRGGWASIAADPAAICLGPWVHSGWLAGGADRQCHRRKRRPFRWCRSCRRSVHATDGLVAERWRLPHFTLSGGACHAGGADWGADPVVNPAVEYRRCIDAAAGRWLGGIDPVHSGARVRRPSAAVTILPHINDRSALRSHNPNDTSPYSIGAKL